MRRCYSCGQEKTLEQFYVDRREKTGHSFECIECCRERHKEAYLSKKGESTVSDLVNASQVATQFAISEALAKSYIETAKVKAHKLVVGKDSMTLYEKAEAEKAVTTRVKEEKEIQAANLARLEAAKIPTLKEVMACVKGISVAMPDLMDAAEQTKKLMDQNAIIFKLLGEIKSQMYAKGETPDTQIKQVEAKEKPTFRVGVIGIYAADQASINKDFGDIFRLTLLTPDESRKISGLKNMDKVFLMSKVVGHKHLELIKSVGVEPTILRGSVNELRDALTALYVAEE